MSLYEHFIFRCWCCVHVDIVTCDHCGPCGLDALVEERLSCALCGADLCVQSTVASYDRSRDGLKLMYAGAWLGAKEKEAVGFGVRRLRQAGS
eukprot:scaffold21193_cov31-Tisochrysis_lutea.AAC.1